MSSLATFIAKIKPSNAGPVHFVIGNEACDADSTVSAITVAYLRSQCIVSVSPATVSPIPVCPVIACPRSDLQFRPETVKLLQQASLKPDDLVFLDDLSGELDPLLLQNKDLLTLTLTDHNTGSLQGKLGLGPSVLEIIDHHEDSGGIKHVQGPLRRIEFGTTAGFEPKKGLDSTCNRNRNRNRNPNRNPNPNRNVTVSITETLMKASALPVAW